jgi:hypothetical protein
MATATARWAAARVKLREFRGLHPSYPRLH